MKQILVIDDDESIRSVFVECLRFEGYSTVGAESGEEALQLLDRGLDPSIIFTDLVMSEMSGGQFLSTYFNKFKGSSVPVVVMTGLNFTPIIPGAAFVIKKPFAIEDIEPLLLKHCEKVEIPSLVPKSRLRKLPVDRIRRKKVTTQSVNS